MDWNTNEDDLRDPHGENSRYGDVGLYVYEDDEGGHWEAAALSHTVTSLMELKMSGHSSSLDQAKLDAVEAAKNMQVAWDRLHATPDALALEKEGLLNKLRVAATVGDLMYDALGRIAAPVHTPMGWDSRASLRAAQSDAQKTRLKVDHILDSHKA